jgi:hypothetical protein
MNGIQARRLGNSPKIGASARSPSAAITPSSA